MKTLKSLWRLVLYRPWLLLLSMILWTIVEAIPLLPPLIVRGILDNLSGSSGLDERFWWLLALVVGVYLGRIVLTYAATAVHMFFAFSVRGLLRQNMLKAILEKPGAQALPVSPGETLNRFRDDVEAVVDTLGWPEDVFGKFILSVAAIGILFAVDARITLFIFLPLSVVLVLLQQARKRIRKYREASRIATSNVVGAMNETFSSVQAIKVAGAEEHVIKHLEKLNQARHKAMLKDTLFVKVLESALRNVVHIGTGLILLLAAQSMRAGNFSVGDFALFTSYWFCVADFTDNLGGLLASYQQAGVSIKRLIELFNCRSASELVKHEPLYLKGDLPDHKNRSICDRLDPLKSLGIRNLSYRFSGSGNGIKNVSFTVAGGSFTVVTGRIGSGKSTLLRVLLGLLPRESGTILWNDQAVDDPSTFFAPPRSAYTGQVPNLFSDTVKNNILLGQWDEQQDLSEPIRSAVLERDLPGFEHGLETMIGPRGVKLSGGQIQRVAAARMFASNSQLYVFDDISSALDVETENLLWSRLFERSDVTCIAVSNRHAALQKADHIVVMDDGQIVAQGTLNELLETCREMRQIYGKNTQSA